MSWAQLKTVCLTHDAFKDIRSVVGGFIFGLDDWPTVDQLNEQFKSLRPDFPWTFVVQPKVPRRRRVPGATGLTKYIELIETLGQIPVRQKNAHDFLNAVSFLLFPRSKLALNRRHHFESPTGIAAGQNRTRTQDLLTIMDEGGVIRVYQSPDSFKDFIFGHAIFEHLALQKSVRAARLDLVMPEGHTLPKASDGQAGQSLDELDRVDELCQTRLSDPRHFLDANELSNVLFDRPVSF